MSDNKAFISFDDARRVLDRALQAARGIRVSCGSNAQAMTLRRRCNTFRKMDRYENSKIYPESHKMHKRSPYDELQLRIPPKGSPDDRFLFIEKVSAIEYDIVDLVEEANEAD